MIWSKFLWLRFPWKVHQRIAEGSLYRKNKNYFVWGFVMDGNWVYNILYISHVNIPKFEFFYKFLKGARTRQTKSFDGPNIYIEKLRTMGNSKCRDI